MTINYLVKYANSTTTTTAATLGTGSQSYVSGRRILVIAQAMRNGHSNGHGANWAITDNASTNSITWTKLATLSDTLQGSTFACESVVYRSSELTANESFTVTADPDSSSSADTYFIGMRVVQCENWDGTLAQSASGAAAAATATATLGTAPSSGDQQFGCLLMQNGSTITAYNSPPTNFTVLTGSQTTTVQGGRCITSTTNTVAAITDGVSTGGTTFFSTHMWALVLNETAGDATVTPATIAATAALPQPGVSVGVSPSTIQATSALPTPGVSVGAAPATIAVSSALPTPNVVGDALVSPATIALLAALAKPNISVGAAPATVAGVFALPTPTIDTGGSPATVNPATITVVSALPKPAIPAEVLPAAIAVLASVPTPTIVTGAGPQPATISVVAAVPKPGVSVGTTPETIAVISALPTPSIAIGADPAPATIGVVSSIPKPDVSVGAAPAAIVVVADIPTPAFVGERLMSENPFTLTVGDLRSSDSTADRDHSQTVGDTAHTSTTMETQ